jgi:small neutral amino acid transporter SnatA (MarC family)
MGAKAGPASRRAADPGGVMRRLSVVVLLVVAVVVVGGIAFLATWDIPAPTSRVEKVIPNDRFPR